MSPNERPGLNYERLTTKSNSQRRGMPGRGWNCCGPTLISCLTRLVLQTWAEPLLHQWAQWGGDGTGEG